MSTGADLRGYARAAYRGTDVRMDDGRGTVTCAVGRTQYERRLHTCDMKRGFGLCIYFALRPTTYNLYACGVLEGPGSE